MSGVTAESGSVYWVPGKGGKARQMAAVAQLLHPLWACKWLLSYTGCKQSLKAQDHVLRVIWPSKDSQGSRSASKNCLVPSLHVTALAVPPPRSSPSYRILPAHSLSPMMTLSQSSHTR